MCVSVCIDQACVGGFGGQIPEEDNGFPGSAVTQGITTHCGY